jgi:hypothetical protein
MTPERALQILDQLMHAGPCPDGTIPEDCKNLALQLGKHAINAMEAHEHAEATIGCTPHTLFHRISEAYRMAKE